MGLLKGIKERLLGERRDKKVFEDALKQQEEISVINVHDSMQRESFVKEKLEQIAEASKEVESLTKEYDLVNTYLTDMEMIDELPPEIRSQLNTLSKQIIDYSESKKKGRERKAIMTQEEYDHMERISEYMPKGYDKLKQTEEYQVLVKNDLNRLDGERHSYMFRKSELESVQRNMKGITIICLSSMALLMIILAALSQTLHIEVGIGYCISIVVAATALTMLYVKYNEASKEIARIERTLNKLIALQNTVKIRYVNNTNLLDYLYAKYDVKSSNALKKLWEKYEQENHAREAQEQIQRDMEFSQAALIKVLKRCKLEIPNIWTHQAQALINEKEMAEIRHGLISRRQKLRKQMEYNSDIAQKSQDEIKELVQQFPQYAKPILEIVSEYEQALA